MIFFYLKFKNMTLTLIKYASQAGLLESNLQKYKNEKKLFIHHNYI